jgi:hypothetical protein
MPADMTTHRLENDAMNLKRSSMDVPTLACGCLLLLGATIGAASVAIHKLSRDSVWDSCHRDALHRAALQVYVAEPVVRYRS